MPKSAKARLLIALPFLLAFAPSSFAAVHYVDASNPYPFPPFADWKSAAKVIQDAVDAAQAGDTVLVADGHYAIGGRAAYGAMTNRVAVDRAILVQSVHGPATTFIHGYQVPGTTNGEGAVRCVYLTNGAVLSGFTLTNGATRGLQGDYVLEQTGGGVRCESIAAVVTNCTLTGNSASSMGGGAYAATLRNCVLMGNSARLGAGACYGVINNCALTGNWSCTSGGGVESATLTNCILTLNSTEGDGGGAHDSALAGCTLTGNFASRYGGGARGGSLSGCSLVGNGAGYGGGASYASLADCTLTSNSADYDGGGAHEATLDHCTLAGNSAPQGGGSCFGTLNHCAFNGNFSTKFGGGACSGLLTDCTLTGNAADIGGGAYASTLNNCAIDSNSASTGGGVNLSTLNHCSLTGNSAYSPSEAASGGGAFDSTLTNCALTRNSAGSDGGGAYRGTLNNCTLTDNSAALFGGGAAGSVLNNCIVFYNTALDYSANQAGGVVNYTCTTPLPPSGTGNVSSDPLFVDRQNGNLRLQTNSPCINTGLNDWVVDGIDLDGRPRTQGGRVDMGAYEFQGPCFGAFIPWLKQCALPTDGSADFADPDHDGLNNWQEWLCGTDPTNAASVLRLLTPALTAKSHAISWQSVEGVSYFLERSTNSSAPPRFIPLATNIFGQPGTTTFIDTNAPPGSPSLYRIGVIAP